jgi:hypothetical protein
MGKHKKHKKSKRAIAPSHVATVEPFNPENQWRQVLYWRPLAYDLPELRVIFSRQ